MPAKSHCHRIKSPLGTRIHIEQCYKIYNGEVNQNVSLQLTELGTEQRNMTRLTVRPKMLKGQKLALMNLYRTSVRSVIVLLALKMCSYTLDKMQ